MTWSECFRSYIERRFGKERPQQEAAQSLKTAPSNVHYWCRRMPREPWRKRIAQWSKGEVPAELMVRRSRPSIPPAA